MKNLGILGAIFAMALSTRGSNPRDHAQSKRPSRSRNICNPDRPNFGNKLARLASKGRIGCRHGVPVPTK